MIEEIKRELIAYPEKLKNVLSYFGYKHITVRPNYIQFGRSETSSPKSIVIRLKNNDRCWVNDYALNINQDIFSYICSQRELPFSNVIRKIRELAEVDLLLSNSKIYRPFGGFYDNIYKSCEQISKVYDECILDEYVKASNIRFLKDGITLQTQRVFDIRFDVISQAIVIPIYDEVGRLVGVKERFNRDVEQGEMKYFYSYPCYMSRVLYGFLQNYNYLAGNTVYIFEAEKSVMQCHSYGIRNCVALGSGSISPRQCELLMSLYPVRVVFMHDVGYSFENIKRNMENLSEYTRFSKAEIAYWDNESGLYDDKVSPSDMGRDMLEYILENEIKMWRDDEI